MAIYLFHISKIIKLLKFEYFSKLRKNKLKIIEKTIWPNNTQSIKKYDKKKQSKKVLRNS